MSFKQYLLSRQGLTKSYLLHAERNWRRSQINNIQSNSLDFKHEKKSEICKRKQTAKNRCWLFSKIISPIAKVFSTYWIFKPIQLTILNILVKYTVFFDKMLFEVTAKLRIMMLRKLSLQCFITVVDLFRGSMYLQ